MRLDLIRRLQRIFALLSLLLILLIGLLASRSMGAVPSDLGVFLDLGRFLMAPPQVALISGHAGYDPGAVCTDDNGATLLTEADVNARAVTLTAARLRRSGLRVVVLDEYDERLDDLSADVLLSLHADSCVELSGYKATHRTNSRHPEVEAALLACINQHYAAHTKLAFHSDTITHDMTAYHAFQRVHPNTPSAILEMGFLGGDRNLLTDGVEQVADGVAESILCFLNEQEPES